MRKIYDALRWLVCTKLGWLIISMIWGGVFLVIDNTQDSNWALILAAPAILYVIGLFLIMVVYAYILNPISEYRDTKGTKDKHSELLTHLCRILLEIYILIFCTGMMNLIFGW